METLKIQIDPNMPGDIEHRQARLEALISMLEQHLPAGFVVSDGEDGYQVGDIKLSRGRVSAGSIGSSAAAGGMAAELFAPAPRRQPTVVQIEGDVLVREPAIERQLRNRIAVRGHGIHDQNRINNLAARIAAEPRQPQTQAGQTKQRTEQIESGVDLVQLVMSAMHGGVVGAAAHAMSEHLAQGSSERAPGSGAPAPRVPARQPRAAPTPKPKPKPKPKPPPPPPPPPPAPQW